MSGGAFNYHQINLAYEIFGWDMTCQYGETGHKYDKNARKINPMRNREVSELVWDVLCLIHSLDWSQSGDTDDEQYDSDLKWFRDKWFKRSDAEVIESYKQDIREFADAIIAEIGSAQ